MVAQALTGQVHRLQRPQGAEATQSVQQKGIHIAHLHHLLFTRRFGAPAHNRHEQRNQRRGDDQDQGRHPGLTGHGGHDRQRKNAHAPHGALIAGQPGHDGLGLLGHRTGGLT